MKKLIKLGAFILTGAALILISGCAEEETAKETTREGYDTYSRYGFSFEYPKNFMVFEQGVLESQANDTSGLVSSGYSNGEYQEFSVWWMKAREENVDLEAGIEEGFVGLEMDETLVSLERGELIETTKDGHRMLYQYYTATFTDIGEASRIYGELYCDKNQKIYDLSTLSNSHGTKAEAISEYQDYMGSFVGH